MVEFVDGRAAINARIEHFAYASKRVLTDVTIKVAAGESLSILGPSGSGKSTVIGIIAGLLPRSKVGQFNGSVELFDQSPRAFRNSGALSVMFQDPSLFPHMTASENVQAPLKMRRQTNLDSVDDILKIVGLENHGDKLPHELSGGMKTRVALARCFVSKPKILLLDEPFSSLDLGRKESLYGSLRDLRARFGTTVILVTHNLEESVYISNSVIVLDERGFVREQIRIGDSLEKPYAFSETVSRETSTMSRLAKLLTHRDETVRP